MARPRLIALVIVLAVAAAFTPAPAAKAIQRLGRRALSPITGPIARGYTTTVSFFQALGSLRSIIRESSDLKRENLTLQSQLAELKEVALENETLRNQVGAREGEKERKIVVAQVVGRSSVKFVPELTIDRGAADGVAVDQPILVAGHLIGVVVDASGSQATVRLVSAHNSLVPVVLANSRATGLLRGGLRGLVVEDLPSDVAINPGEPVVTETIGSFKHAGIPVGTIEKVISSQSEIFQVVSVRSPIDATTVSFVSVVVP